MGRSDGWRRAGAWLMVACGLQAVPPFAVATALAASLLAAARRRGEDGLDAWGALATGLLLPMALAAVPAFLALHARSQWMARLGSARASLWKAAAASWAWLAWGAPLLVWMARDDPDAGARRLFVGAAATLVAAASFWAIVLARTRHATVGTRSVPPPVRPDAPDPDREAWEQADAAVALAAWVQAAPFALLVLIGFGLGVGIAEDPDDWAAVFMGVVLLLVLTAGAVFAVPAGLGLWAREAWRTGRPGALGWAMGASSLLAVVAAVVTVPWGWAMLPRGPEAIGAPAVLLAAAVAPAVLWGRAQRMARRPGAHRHGGRLRAARTG